jgi:GTP-binding protein YchF
MEVGIIGLQQSGKTSLFDTLTGGHASAQAGAMRPNVGVAKVPDPRLAVIATHVPTKKIVHATMQFVDLPGFATGEGGAKAGPLLAHIRTVDALCQVVRCFPEAGSTTPPKPVSDIETLDTELILADMVVVESSRDKAAKAARGAKGDAAARLAVLEKILPTLSEGQAVRARGDLSQAEFDILKSYGLITAKPVLYVANVAEEDLAGESEAAKAVKAYAERAGGQYVAICAKLEAELAQLEESERAEMLTGLGLTEPAIGPLARAAYQLLGLMSFYTAGEKEVRAWTIPIGATASEAAGAIHSDLERGFIRSETYSVADLEQHGSEKAIKEAGKLRSEGRAYKVKDGDVMHILFNV